MGKIASRVRRSSATGGLPTIGAERNGLWMCMLRWHFHTVVLLRKPSFFGQHTPAGSCCASSREHCHMTDSPSSSRLQKVVWVEYETHRLPRIVVAVGSIPGDGTFLSFRGTVLVKGGADQWSHYWHSGSSSVQRVCGIVRMLPVLRSSGPLRRATLTHCRICTVGIPKSCSYSSFGDLVTGS